MLAFSRGLLLRCFCSTGFPSRLTETTKVSRYDVRLRKHGANPRPGVTSRFVCFYFLRKNRNVTLSADLCVWAATMIWWGGLWSSAEGFFSQHQRALLEIKSQELSGRVNDSSVRDFLLFPKAITRNELIFYKRSAPKSVRATTALQCIDADGEVPMA